jgi:hypothetical protein
VSASLPPRLSQPLAGRLVGGDLDLEDVEVEAGDALGLVLAAGGQSADGEQRLGAALAQRVGELVLVD